MNRKQKITMWVAIGILALMLLVPPWKYVYSREGRYSERDAPWAPIFTPPHAPAYTYAQIDTPRLVLEMGAVALVAAGLFVTFRSGKKGEPR